MRMVATSQANTTRGTLKTGNSPTDFTAQKLGCLSGGALVSSAPTKQNRYSPTESTEPTELLAECILPQISQICTEVRLPSRGCTCLRSALPLARARSAPTKQKVHQPNKIDILPQISQICTDKTNTNLSNRTNTGLPTFVLSE